MSTTVKIAAMMVLDHQETMQYPVGFVLGSLRGVVDHAFLYGCDEMSREEFRILTELDPGYQGPPATVLPLEARIEQPNDISRCMNLMWEDVQRRADPDHSLYVQADTLCTPEAAASIKAFSEHPGTNVHAMQIGVRTIRLYCFMAHGHGYTLLGRDFKGKFIGDGTLTKDEGPLPGLRHPFPKKPSCIEIGYMSPELYYRHNLQHGITWNWPEHLLGCRLYEDSPVSFVYATLYMWYARIGKEFVLGREAVPELPAIIEDMGLSEDCKSVEAIVREINAEIRGGLGVEEAAVRYHQMIGG